MNFSIDKRKRLRPADGAHFFFTIIFLVGTIIIKDEFIRSCNGEDIFIETLFYVLVIWMTYLIVTLIPRYTNPGFHLFFEILDIIYSVIHTGLFCWSCIILYEHQAHCGYDLSIKAQYYFIKVYYWCGIIIFGSLLLSVIIKTIKRYFKLNETEDLEESQDMYIWSLT